MLKKTQRLSRAAFTAYFNSGKRFHSPVLTIVYTPLEQFHGSVVVGKKVAKSAVRRNTLRRRIYEQLRQHHQQTGQTGVYIVVTKPAFNALSRQQAREAVEALLAKISKST